MIRIYCEPIVLEVTWSDVLRKGTKNMELYREREEFWMFRYTWVDNHISQLYSHELLFDEDQSAFVECWLECSTVHVYMVASDTY